MIATPKFPAAAGRQRGSSRISSGSHDAISCSEPSNCSTHSQSRPSCAQMDRQASRKNSGFGRYTGVSTETSG